MAAILSRGRWVKDLTLKSQITRHMSLPWAYYGIGCYSYFNCNKYHCVLSEYPVELIWYVTMEVNAHRAKYGPNLNTLRLVVELCRLIGWPDIVAISLATASEFYEIASINLFVITLDWLYMCRSENWYLLICDHKPLSYMIFYPVICFCCISFILWGITSHK